jgi:hypothetical protein
VILGLMETAQVRLWLSVKTSRTPTAQLKIGLLAAGDVLFLAILGATLARFAK